jgi:MoaA/NifB/PqqE/SkfB family radical SAM enzyme
MKKQNGKELNLSEYEKISKQIKVLNILGISGGEPFLRDDLSEIIKVFYKNCEPLVIDLPTNGFFTDRIVQQVEDMLSVLKNTTLDLQLSLDGPEIVHDKIRGVSNSFNNLKKTYENLLPLKEKYKNLKIKICTVYSHYNQDHMLDLFEIIKKDFSKIDRFVLSVVHGSVSDAASFNFDWNKYFYFCEYAEKHIAINNQKDLHSLFTRALRKKKNEILKMVLKKRDMFKKCQAGRKMIVVNEIGDVFPCEPLWSKIGNLRENNYQLDNILNSSEMHYFQRKKIIRECSCHWNVPMINNILYSPKYYQSIAINMIKFGFSHES